MGLPSEDRVRADTSVIQDFRGKYFTRRQMNMAAMTIFQEAILVAQSFLESLLSSWSKVMQEKGLYA